MADKEGGRGCTPVPAGSQHVADLPKATVWQKLPLSWRGNLPPASWKGSTFTHGRSMLSTGKQLQRSKQSPRSTQVDCNGIQWEKYQLSILSGYHSTLSLKTYSFACCTSPTENFSRRASVRVTHCRLENSSGRWHSKMQKQHYQPFITAVSFGLAGTRFL